ncbi:putative membrane protein, partial [Chlamydia psittaci 02DC21]
MSKFFIDYLSFLCLATTFFVVVVTLGFATFGVALEVSFLEVAAFLGAAAFLVSVTFLGSSF